MTKYTINKAFRQDLQRNIWKIEVDCKNSLLAIESRDSDTTQPFFSVINFHGETILGNYTPSEKEWTLEAIQNDYLILKKIGDSSPIKEGIKIIHIKTQHEILTNYEHVLLNVFEGYIQARHRNIVEGSPTYFQIANGQISTHLNQRDLYLPLNRVIYPYPYNKFPVFFQEESIQENLWFSRVNHTYIWCYHELIDHKFNLILAVSDLNQVRANTVVLQEMDKMVPQPYFQVESQLFFLSYNKQEIVSYLV